MKCTVVDPYTLELQPGLFIPCYFVTQRIVFLARDGPLLLIHAIHVDRDRAVVDGMAGRLARQSKTNCYFKTS